MTSTVKCHPLRHIQNTQQETTIEALRESRSQQTVQHDAEVKAMIAEKKDLSDRNDEQEAYIGVLQDTLKEIEETLSHENDHVQAQLHAIQADKDTLDTGRYYLSLPA